MQKIEFQSKILEYFGLASYEIYLVHVSIRGIFRYHEIQLFIGDNGFIIIFIFVTAIITIPLYFIDKKVNSIIKNHPKGMTLLK